VVVHPQDDQRRISSSGGSNLMNEEEEDALDPIYDHDRGRDREDREDFYNNKRDSLFDGEEENVDEKYSLLHDDSIVENHGQHRQQQQHHHQQSCPIEPFNMNAEREDGMGYFDGDTYIFRKRGRNRDNVGEDEEEYDDGEESWMNQVYVNPIPTKQTSDENNHKTNNNLHRDDTLTKTEIYKELASLLANDSETILQALSRYGSIVWKKYPKGNQVKDNNVNNHHNHNNHNNNKRQKILHSNKDDSYKDKDNASTSHNIAKTAFYRLTELSNLCMMKFDDGQIYDRDRKYLNNYDDVVQPLSTGGETKDGDDQSLENEHQVQWEYRGNVDNRIHGPFTTKQMMDWIQAGYFVGSNAVDVRRKMVHVGQGGGQGGGGVAAQQGNEDNKEGHDCFHGRDNEKVQTQHVMDDLLGDLQESDNDDDDNDDDDNDDHDNAGGNHTSSHHDMNEPWQRSDQVDFSAYM
jgi:CD2 antigen cytoplasmic tail-binding protein 2